LIVGASLIFIIIYINTLNKKREIGILKAVGVTKSSIISSYIFISMFYVLMGVFAGLILYFLLMYYFTIKPISFYETITVIPEIQVGLIIKRILTMVGMSAIAGFVPAWLVARQEILKAIWGER
jgi:putative ABC transport system permease protein